MSSKKLSIFVIFILLLSGCAGTTSVKEDTTPLSLKQASFADLDGWKDENFQDFMSAYKVSCARILKKKADAAFSANPAFGQYGPWQDTCRKGASVNAADATAVRNFIEQNFKVMQATAAGDPKGLFTGYYESTLNGSRSKGGPYQYPLLARPTDLVMVELGDFRDELKGQRIAGRVLDGKLKPYESRAQIVAGKLPAAQFKPLVWLDDPQDAFFVQVQGSGIVHLDDGSIMRVGYDGQNGHPYYAIGRELVKRGVYTKDEVSMDSIRQWLTDNPSQAQELMNTNPSFVFFRETPDDGSGAGPQGAEGVRLTPKRSLAVDSAKLPYGFPVYVVADYKDETGRPLRRLVMAQDTGGAIRGAVRGDFFWGSGAQAEQFAGPMKAQGKYFFLMPKGV